MFSDLKKADQLVCDHPMPIEDQHCHLDRVYNHLAWVMDCIAQGKEMPNRIQVDSETSRDAMKALDRMLELS
jgi:quinolinate synthase